jgi:hypothetical protein
VILFAVANSTTSLLFLLRVFGIFRDNKRVIMGFCLLWACTSVSTLLIIPATDDMNLAEQTHCSIFHQNSYICVPFVSILVFDTLSFVTISCKLYRLTALHEDLGGMKWWHHFRGKFLPQISRMILQEGQMYFWFVHFHEPN